MASYLGAPGFIRNILPPEYSGVAAQMRDLTRDADPDHKLPREVRKTQLRMAERTPVERCVPGMNVGWVYAS